MKKIVVTGGAGQIAYSLLFRIASGELLGSDKPIALHILDIPQMENVLEAVAMELEDCAFPLLKEIHYGCDPFKLFKGVDYAFLVGAKPRGKGMERKDLLMENGIIFQEQGRALNQVASKNVLTLIVGNPSNTNALITLKNAPDLKPHQFFSMMRLDQNRAQAMLAKKANIPLTSVTNTTIWGNHSSTQVPDFLNTQINHQPALEVIQDRNWCESTFIPAVQQRGATVIQKRGKSSAASAAHAALQAMQAAIFPTPNGHYFSHASYSANNPYGIDEDLIFSFPSRSLGDGKIEVISTLIWDEFLEAQIKRSEQELIDERTLISSLL